MKLTSFLSSVFLVLITIGSAIAQIETQEYKSPLTIENMEVTYNANADGTYTVEQNARVRINIDLAVQSSAQTYLPFSESLQTLEVLEAYTETAAGEKIVVPADKIITGESPISVKAPHFSDYKVTAVVYPQISVGAAKTIHFKMTQTKPHFENHFSMFETFPLSLDINSATLTVIAPEDLKLHIQAVDIEGGKLKTDTPGQSRWTWAIKDQKGQMPEQIAINTQNFSPRIVVSTFADYNEVAEAYLKHKTGGQIFIIDK
jgi:transglutaminase-like putative cysteine protease